MSYNQHGAEASTQPTLAVCLQTELSLTLFIPGFFGWCSTGGGGVFHLYPVTPLSLKSDDSNFVQNYFGVGSIFCGKKNGNQIYNDVTMTSSLL